MKKKEVRIACNSDWDIIFSTSEIYKQPCYLITYTRFRDLPKIRVI